MGKNIIDVWQDQIKDYWQDQIKNNPDKVIIDRLSALQDNCHYAPWYIKVINPEDLGSDGIKISFKIHWLYRLWKKI